MKTITWEPGTNTHLDNEFERLRQHQFDNKNHRLWKNYGKDAFAFAVALTICWNDFEEPEMCSSISIRDCWPDNTYRILNRLWKHSNKISYPKKMSPSFAETAKSQISWLEKNTSCKLFFISRQTENWGDWVLRNFQEVYGISFESDNHYYLTCPNEDDETCWQRIIYHGDSRVLDKWKRRL
jgi:hypothetical protein